MSHARYLIALASFSMLLISVAGSAARQDVEHQQQRGAQIYLQDCAGCHGSRGDGHGPERIINSIRPPDFTTGEIRYKTTAAGVPPTPDDLMKTVAYGVLRTSMPQHTDLGDHDRRAVVEYVASFFPEWLRNQPAPASVELPPQPVYFGSAASIDRGRRVYMQLGCDACHGSTGAATGTGVALPADSRGSRQQPIDLRRTTFKGGGRLPDVFTTLVTGLDGTAMQPHADDLLRPDGGRRLEGDGWHLAQYVLSLGQHQQ
ncbi:MAG: c-type cytochrome [bacterium]|nr:c-type cytochrome [bacterium]